jgi:hypothetical protein
MSSIIVTQSQVNSEKILNDLRDSITSENNRRTQLTDAINSAQTTLTDLQVIYVICMC